MFNHLFSCAILTLIKVSFSSIKAHSMYIVKWLTPRLSSVLHDSDMVDLSLYHLIQQSFISVCFWHISLREFVRRFKWYHVYEKAREIKGFAPYIIQIFLKLNVYFGGHKDKLDIVPTLREFTGYWIRYVYQSLSSYKLHCGTCHKIVVGREQAFKSHK